MSKTGASERELSDVLVDFARPQFDARIMVDVEVLPDRAHALRLRESDANPVDVNTTAMVAGFAELGPCASMASAGATLAG